MVKLQRFGPLGLYTQSTVTSASKTSSGCVCSEQQSGGLVWDMVSEVKHNVGNLKSRREKCIL